MMENTKILEVPALKLKQPIGDFFIAAMKAHELVSISYADVRKLQKNELNNYMGINRRLTKNRVKELQSYVKTYDATFPTNIILAVASENVNYDEKKGILRLTETKETDQKKIAKIIDGQHRIAGLEAITADTDFELGVAIFVGSDIATRQIYLLQ